MADGQATSSRRVVRTADAVCVTDVSRYLNTQLIRVVRTADGRTADRSKAVQETDDQGKLNDIPRRQRPSPYSTRLYQRTSTRKFKLFIQNTRKGKI